jgi:hypothetical protein
VSLWAAFCHREGLSFEAFSAGCDLLLDDRELWESRGFVAMRDEVRQ